MSEADELESWFCQEAMPQFRKLVWDMRELACLKMEHLFLYGQVEPFIPPGHLAYLLEEVDNPT